MWKSPPPTRGGRNAEGRQPRGISDGGLFGRLPPTEIARESRSQFRPPRVGGGDSRTLPYAANAICRAHRGWCRHAGFSRTLGQTGGSRMLARRRQPYRAFAVSTALASSLVCFAASSAQQATSAKL